MIVAASMPLQHVPVSQGRMFWNLRWRIIRNAGSLLFGNSRVRLISMVLASAIICAALFLGANFGFKLIARSALNPSSGIVGLIFSAMFFALGIMLVISSGLILYASLFTGAEAKFLLATPAVFLLGASGLYALQKGLAGTRAPAILISAMVGTVALYFSVHSLHAEVHPDYLSMSYPAFALAAAVAAHLVVWPRHWQLLVNFSRRWAVPGSIAIFAALIFQINVGLLNRADPWVRITAVGFRNVADEIAQVRDRLGATCVLVGDFGTTAWLMFYLPKDSCVAQRNERIRWANMPEPDAARLGGRLLFVSANYPAWRYLGYHTKKNTPVALLERKRGAAVIERYELMLLEAQTGDVFDRTPPRELAKPSVNDPE